MAVFDQNEIEVFSLAHAKLLAKAREAGKELDAQEIARRMLIVQAERVYDPDEFDERVLADRFPDPQKTNGAYYLGKPNYFR